MSADTWYAISLVGYFIALIGLIITTVLYLKLDILDVIGDLTGRTVARELKTMRENRNYRGSKNVPGMRRYNRTASTAKAGKSSRFGKKTAGAKTASKTAGAGKLQETPRRKAKNGTAEMGTGSRAKTASTGNVSAQADKLVLHSKTDKLSRDTEELYEDFDPRVEYSRTDKLEVITEQTESRGTAILRPGTEVLPESGQENQCTGKVKGTQVLPEKGTAVLRNGTELLEETVTGRGTSLLVEDAEIEPVKFSITRSYIVVHSEESIL